MKKKIAFFLLAVAFSFVAASFRWEDSAHSIGLIKAEGGKARHASALRSGKDRYMLIATATVIPPYRGDARVVLEGKPEVEYSLSLTRPLVDLGISEYPELRDGIIYGLKPKDRLALWVEMHPPLVDPVCGMAHEEHFIRHEYEGREYAFCGRMCLDAFKGSPEKYAGKDALTGRYTLAFYDTRTDKPVLTVPVIFSGKGEAIHGGGHH